MGQPESQQPKTILYWIALIERWIEVKDRATEREKMLRIKQITKDGMLHEYQLGDQVEEDIVDYVDINKKKLRELSLRTVLKIADLAKAFPDRWEAMAENTVMRRA